MAYNKHNLKIKDLTRPSSGADRPELGGVFFKPNETVATDGFSLIRVSSIQSVDKEFPVIPGYPHGPKTNFKPFIVSADGVKKLLKTMPDKNKHLPVLNFLYVSKVGKNTAEFVSTDLEKTHITAVRTIEAEYPRFEEVIKEVGGYHEIEVNVNYVKRIIDILADLMKEDRLQGIKIRVPKSRRNAPMIFIANNKQTEQKATAYLMGIMPVEERVKLQKKV